MNLIDIKKKIKPKNSHIVSLSLETPLNIEILINLVRVYGIDQAEIVLPQLLRIKKSLESIKNV